MSYTVQRYLAIAVAMVLAGLGIIQVADPADFGLSMVAVRWLGVVTAMLGVLAGFLPSVRGQGKDPEFLADRVSDLAPRDQALVVRDVQGRAGEMSPSDAVIAAAGLTHDTPSPDEVLASIEAMSEEDLDRIRDAALARHQTLISQPPRFLTDAERPAREGRG